MAGCDELQGGFSHAPKFPTEPVLFLLLQEAERTADSAVLEAVTVTLDAMAGGGIHDQVGGGFHRYSTDNEWLVPHFEKMLYNQAHLARAYLLAWRLTGNAEHRRVAAQTLDYVLRDMTSPDGVFYSATDADSAGKEGLFFLWTKEQIQQALSASDAAFAIELFGVTDGGNYEDSNILFLPQSLEAVAAERGETVKNLLAHLDDVREEMYAVRTKREHPLRDEKIILAWNAMMISSLAQAGSLLNDPRYLLAARRSAEQLWATSRGEPGQLWRVQLNGAPSIAEHQEDYAYFAEALLHLHDATAESRWLIRAQEVANAMLATFFGTRSMAASFEPSGGAAYGDGSPAGRCH
jgi:uncharacterized protein